MGCIPILSFSGIKCPYFFTLTSFKRLGQKSLQKFRWFFRRFEDIKSNYWNDFSLEYNPILRIPLDYIVESSQRPWFSKTYTSNHFTNLLQVH